MKVQLGIGTIAEPSGRKMNESVDEKKSSETFPSVIAAEGCTPVVPSTILEKAPVPVLYSVTS
jgi:hypothetical protein